jgi:mRNA interferase MazF
MIRRGEVWWVNLADPIGSEPGYRHPGLVIQRDEVNASRINTVVICVLTSNTALAPAPGNTLLSKRRTKLRRDSVANASQIVTVNKSDLHQRIGMLPESLMERVDSGLRWFLHLDAS